MAIAGAVRSNEVKRIPLCHIHFAGQTRHGGLEYNELGQLLVVCDWNLYILVRRGRAMEQNKGTY